MPPTDSRRPPALPRVEPPPTPPSMRAPARRRTLHTRGGRWLLPDPDTTAMLPTPSSLPGPERGQPGAGGPGALKLGAIADALDLRSPVDRSRWIRLQAEARRWMERG